MKVKHLKEGMLLCAKTDLRPTLRCEHAQDHLAIDTIRFMYAPLSSHTQQVVFMYLGSKKDSYKWDTVYKHHRVLLNGRVLHLSGYDVKHIKPANLI